MRLDLTAFLACSGAKTTALTAIFKGQLPQLDALAAADPDVVTITIGGNDIGFSAILINCYVLNPPLSCVKDGTIAKAKANIDALGRIISGVYNALKLRVRDATIVVVGYPRLFPDKSKPPHKCAWLQSDEQKALNDLADQLDKALRAAADGVSVVYVPTATALEGHELCTKDSWVFPIKTKKAQPAAAHPKLAGQNAIANLVLAKLAGLR